MSGEDVALHLLISGVVQGVGYRNWAQKQAQALGLSGWVRNLTDGRVELWAEGPAAQRAVLAERCRTGPRHAEVTELAEAPGAPTGVQGFSVRSTAPL
ncbi:MAG: acylphosphatase [Deltaproteobacteria bacterium]|nr:acylphosphatase [Deltaproteobacteria bacterium]